MSTHHRQEFTTAHGSRNETRPPSQEHIDGQIASESASDTGNWQNATARSLEPLSRNILTSKVEQVPQGPIPYKEIVSMMQEQAERIQKLERNLQEVRGVTNEQSHQNQYHRVRDQNEPHQYWTR